MWFATTIDATRVCRWEKVNFQNFRYKFSINWTRQPKVARSREANLQSGEREQYKSLFLKKYRTKLNIFSLKKNCTQKFVAYEAERLRCYKECKIKIIQIFERAHSLLFYFTRLMRIDMQIYATFVFAVS